MPAKIATRFVTHRCSYDNDALGWEHWGQTTIPKEGRAALHVAPGDLIAWEVDANGTATVRRVRPLDLEYLRAVEGTLSEWASSAGEEAYREL